MKARIYLEEVDEPKYASHLEDPVVAVYRASLGGEDAEAAVVFTLSDDRAVLEMVVSTKSRDYLVKECRPVYPGEERDCPVSPCYLECDLEE